MLAPSGLTLAGYARQTLKLEISRHVAARLTPSPVSALLLKTAVLLSCAVPVWAQAEYQGPSVLSRGAVASNRAPARQFGFRPFAGVNAIYDSGLTITSVDQIGNAPNVGAYGVEALVGVGAFRTWKKTALGLDYRGDFRHYTGKTYFDGSDHLFSLGLSRQLSRRWDLTLREAAGTFTRAFGFLSGYGFYDPELLVVPVNEIFDNRTTYASTAADFTYQKSVRLSFNGGADGFLVRRRAPGLIGVTGAAARGDVAYRYSRHGTVGLDYRFMHVDFTNAFGASDIHSLGLNYSVRLSRPWEIALHAGISRVETLGLRRVTIDPSIAIILGIRTGVEVAHRLNYVPDFYGRLTRSFRHGLAQVSYSNRLNPGSAIFRLAQQQNVQVQYTYTGVRHWHFSARAGYNRLRSITETGGEYDGVGAGLGISRVLRRDFHAQLRVDGQRYEGGFMNTIRRTRARVTLGIMYSPGEMPLPFW